MTNQDLRFTVEQIYQLVCCRIEPILARWRIPLRGRPGRWGWGRLAMPKRSIRLMKPTANFCRPVKNPGNQTKSPLVLIIGRLGRIDNPLEHSVELEPCRESRDRFSDSARHILLEGI